MLLQSELLDLSVMTNKKMLLGIVNENRVLGCNGIDDPIRQGENRRRAYIWRGLLVCLDLCRSGWI